MRVCSGLALLCLCLTSAVETKPSFGYVQFEENEHVSLLQVGSDGTSLGQDGLKSVEDTEAADVFSMKKCVAEFIAMTFFVFLGCGSAMSVAKTEGSAWVLQVALSFGFAITVLAYAIGHYSGGQINCAVTFGLMLHGDIAVMQGIGNIIAQLLGSVLGALILLVMYGPSSQTKKNLDQTGGLGTNAINDGWSTWGTLIGEFTGTYLLMFVVLETAVNPANSSNTVMAPLAIGLAVFLAHSVLIPIDGCSINPGRSFGPAIVNVINDRGAAVAQLWVFWVGPLLGAAAAVGTYISMTGTGLKGAGN